ncbi:MAG: zf-TFIIB domain-containing protein [Myxococcota bacterium]|nr:zf-TFIIB domain-containing protein [Myxococcota bacterium]
MPTTAPRQTRCESCARVFDTSPYNTGAAISCHCGATIVVRDITPHDSLVIRCSSCGGSRPTKADACGFCGASFTLRDKQLTGLCSGCGARASATDIYCRACGDTLVSPEQAAHPGEKSCPVCADHPALHHRELQDVALLECVHCGGVWLDRHAFGALASRAREHARLESAHNPKIPSNVRPQAGPAYRRCIECDAVMQRKNYGRKSGVIVDICAKHGMWFDLHELEEVLAWLRGGGVEVKDPPPAHRSENITKMVSSQTPQPSGDGILSVGDLIVDILHSFFFR